MHFPLDDFTPLTMDHDAVQLLFVLFGILLGFSTLVHVLLLSQNASGRHGEASLTGYLLRKNSCCSNFSRLTIAPTQMCLQLFKTFMHFKSRKPALARKPV